MSYLARIAAWKALIKSSYTAKFDEKLWNELHSSHQELFAGGPDVGADVEISFRETLADTLGRHAEVDVSAFAKRVSWLFCLTCNFLPKQVTTENSDAFCLLRFAFAFAVKFQALSPAQIPKLPFMMMEDIMECQTIDKAEAIWQIIESLTDTITHPDIFPKGDNAR